MAANKGDVYVTQVEAMAKLRVTIEVDEHLARRLLVYAWALMQDDNDVRYWTLHEVLDVAGGGLWLHPASGESGALTELLRGIANCYLDQEARG